MALIHVFHKLSKDATQVCFTKPKPIASSLAVGYCSYISSTLVFVTHPEVHDLPQLQIVLCILYVRANQCQSDFGWSMIIAGFADEGRKQSDGLYSAASYYS